MAAAQHQTPKTSSVPLAIQQEKKRLQGFLGEILRVGCLKGFKYFALYLRGREELICRVLNEPMSQEILSYYISPTSEKMKTGKSSFSFDSPHSLPRNDRFAISDDGTTKVVHGHDQPEVNKEIQSLIMSANTQKSLSGYGFMDIGLPPASPSERDIDLKDDKSTLFLIAAYARYNCPYVWVRSNHERLVSFTGGGDESKLRDSPLKLKSTTTWKLNDTKLWDIIGEVVKLCMYPAPLNPFAIDFQYFEGLPLGERLIATGAMVSFLQKVVSSGDHVYNARVFDDLGELTRQHFKDLQTFSRQEKSKEISARQQGMTQQPAQYYQAGSMQSYHTHYQAY